MTMIRDWRALDMAGAIAKSLGSEASPDREHGEDAPVRVATSVTPLYGNGRRLLALAVEYDRHLDNALLSSAAYRVQGYAISRAYANTCVAPAHSGVNGRYVILELSVDEPEIEPTSDLIQTAHGEDAFARVIQIGPVAAADGTCFPPNTAIIPMRSFANSASHKE